MPGNQFLSSLRVRRMQIKDLDEIVELFLPLGWTTTRQDVENLLMFEPLGCFVAELKGELVGSVTTTKYTHFGWVGMLLVKEQFRRRRIGTTLMKTAIRYLLDNGMATVRLDADPPGIPLYEHMGFQKECDSLRWSRESPQRFKMKGVRQATLNDLKRIFPLDRRAFGDNRQRVLARFFEHSCNTLVVDDEPHRAMLMARQSSHGTLFGPFIADSINLANKLLQAGLSLQKSQRVIVGMPSTNQNAITLMKQSGFECKSVLSRMFYGRTPIQSDSALEYGIGSSATG